MNPDTERRFINAAIERGLVSRETVDHLRQQTGVASDSSSIITILCAAKVLDYETAVSLLREMKSLEQQPTLTQTGNAPPPPITALHPGAEIGPYRIEEELGHGGMGIVYRATDLRLDRPIALKTIRTMADAETAERLVREARAAARLQHPGIVRVFEVETYEGVLVVALELIEGVSLSDHILLQGPMSATKAAELVLDLANAVHAAHRGGIIHRDLKPANVLIDSDGQPRLTDFGLARDERATSTLTATGLAVGTPAYMSPEQAMGEAHLVGPATDVYGLGAVLHEVLCGRPPFAGRTSLAIMLSVVNDAPMSPNHWRRVDHLPLLPPDLVTICLHALEKAPSDRYASAEAFAEDLRHFLAKKPITARPVSTVERVRRWVTRNRALSAATAAAVLLAATSIATTLDARESARLQLASIQQRQDEDLAKARVEEQRRQQAEVEGFLRQLTDGEIGNQPEDEVEALVQLQKYTSPQTASLLGKALDAITRKLRLITREHLLEAAEPTRSERYAGLEPIEGLDDAIDRLLQRKPGEVLDSEASKAIESAMARLEERQYQAQLDAGTNRKVDLRSLLAHKQRKALGPDQLRLARLCCQALGNMRIQEEAVSPLLRHLQAEHDPERAAWSAIALCQLGGDDTAIAMLEALKHFESEPVFARLVQPHTKGLTINLVPEAASGPQVLRLARAQLALGQLFEAAELVDHVLRVEPTAKAWRLLAEIHVRNVEVHDAHEAFSRALASEPNHAETRCRRAEVSLKLGRPQEALADYDLALELDPSLAMAWVGRGQAHFATGDNVRAIHDLEQAVTLKPRHAAAWTTLGRARRGQNDLVGARAALDRAIECDRTDTRARDARAQLRLEDHDYTGALADLTQALQFAPEAAQLWSSRGDAYRMLAMLDQALHDYDEALKLNSKLAAAWSGHGLVQRDQLSLEAATNDLSRAIELDASQASFWVERGRVRTMTGHIKDALADLGRAIDLQPLDAQTWSSRGIAHREAGDLAAALEDHDEAVRLAPTSPWILTNRGTAKQASGDYEGALADYSRVMDLDPTYTDAWINRAEVHLATKHFEMALTDSARAMELDARNPWPWRISGEAHLGQGKLPKALSDLDQALKLKPRYAMAWSAKGRVLVSMGEPQAAMEAFDHSIDFDPRQPAAWYERGRLRAELGQDGAASDLRRFLSLAPNHHHASVAQELLEEGLR